MTVQLQVANAVSRKPDRKVMQDLLASHRRQSLTRKPRMLHQSLFPTKYDTRDL
jgi:hypothetical protein